MPDTSQLALFLAAAFVLAITPGPGIFYVAARTLSGGRAEGIASSVGTGLGGMVHVLAGSLGVSALVLASAELFTRRSHGGTRPGPGPRAPPRTGIAARLHLPRTTGLPATHIA